MGGGRFPGYLFIAYNSLQGPALAIPTQFLAGRAAAAGIAAMNTITMFSGFVGPYWMGVMRDHTGSNQAGLRGLIVPSLAGAAIMYILTRSLKKRPRLDAADQAIECSAASAHSTASL